MPKHPKRLEKSNVKRPKFADKEMDSLVEAAWAAGAWCKRAGNNHIKIYPPNGSRMVPIPSTPSDHKTFQNKRTQLRRGGIPVD